MSPSQMFGIASLVLGAVLLIIGYNASGAPIDQLSNIFTGRYTDRTMWYLIAGAVALVTGVLLTLFGRRA
ncbi:MAG TPA: DUF3185 family protein [Acetobacteraceae bacterium]|nr:DUF3185 family protein [Acetobacteraceae bacterium]